MPAKPYYCIAMKKLFLLLLAGIGLFSCHSKRLENTKELSREIKASQIKRVTNTQLVYTVDEWGKKISKIAEKALEKEIAAHPDQAAANCKSLGKMAVIAALEKEYGVTVELLGAADRTNTKLAPKERELLDAYLYSAKAKTPASDNVQQLNDTLVVYNSPLDPASPLCKACMPGEEPFGLWRLLFDKKEIIRKLDAKMLKE